MSDKFSQLDRTNPEMMQIILLDEISQRLSELIPEGVVEVFTLGITDRLQKYTPINHVFSMHFDNNGPDTVYISINKPGVNEKTVTVGNGWSVVMQGPRIKSVYLHCARGDTASVEVDAVR